ncbi:MAG: hypothetical protein JO057_05090 [Chloroflexi bacterium]|nr:hypothetical protein [Chloroflexota bacterium]
MADVEANGGADEYLVLGNLVAIGYDPISVLERLTALPGVRFVQGNTDPLHPVRHLGAGRQPGWASELARRPQYTGRFDQAEKHSA